MSTSNSGFNKGKWFFFVSYTDFSCICSSFLCLLLFFHLFFLCLFCRVGWGLFVVKVLRVSPWLSLLHVNLASAEYIHIVHIFVCDSIWSIVYLIDSRRIGEDWQLWMKKQVRGVCVQGSKVERNERLQAKLWCFWTLLWSSMQILYKFGPTIYYFFFFKRKTYLESEIFYSSSRGELFVLLLLL